MRASRAMRRELLRWFLGRPALSRSCIRARARSSFMSWCMVDLLGSESLWWCERTTRRTPSRCPKVGRGAVVSRSIRRRPGSCAGVHADVSGHDDALDEQLAAPDAPRLLTVQRAGEALGERRALPAQGLGELDVSRALGEPELCVVLATRDVSAGLSGPLVEVDECGELHRGHLLRVVPTGPAGSSRTCHLVARCPWVEAWGRSCSVHFGNQFVWWFLGRSGAGQHKGRGSRMSGSAAWR